MREALEMLQGSHQDEGGVEFVFLGLCAVAVGGIRLSGKTGFFLEEIIC